MDKNPDACDVLKTALYEHRIVAYDYPPVLEELRKLERDARTGKVDHPKNGRKDVADAFAGVIYGLSEAFAVQREPLPPFVDSMAEVSLETDVRGYLRRGGAALPPIMSGSDDPDLDANWLLGGAYPRP